jgi:sarcosine oxidase
MLRRVQFEGDEYVPLAELAYELWSALERESERPLFTRTGLLILGPSDSQLIRGGRESAERARLEHELLDAGDLRRRYPQHRVGDADIALFDPEAGYISPEAAIAAALERAVALGAALRRNCEVQRLSATAAGVELVTASGSVRVRHAVVAVGTWLGSLVPELAAAIGVERHFFAWVPVRDPALFAPERFPMFIRENGERTGTSIEDSHAHRERILAFGIPTPDGAWLKVGFPVTGTPAASPEVDRRPRPEELAMVEGGLLGELLDGVRAEVTDFTPCLYDNSPDQHFIIGSLPRLPGVTLLGGFSGHGFKHAAAVGEIAAALAVEGRPPLDVSRFSPLRLR